jgi:multiple sugar transport system substrate-binding protein
MIRSLLRGPWPGIWALLLAALAGSAIGAPKPIAVWTRSTFSSDEAAVIKDTAAAFNRVQQRYKVELFASHYRNYADWVQSVGVAGTLPCLLEVDGPFVAEFAWPGYLQPLDKYVPAELRRDLLPSILAQGTYEGHLYSLGQFDSGLGLWANRRYLAAAGVRIPTVARPWTLAEFEQAMEKLARVAGVDYPLNLAVYTGTAEFYSYAYLPIIAGFGGDFIDRAHHRGASGVLDGPRSVAAMTRFQHWFRQGWTRAVFDRNDDFENGKNALAWTGHWKYAAFKAALGDDLILLPLPDFGHGLKTGMGSWSWSITSTCADPAGAWAFLSYLMSPDQILRMSNANGGVPARKSALARSALYGNRKPLEVFAQQLFGGAGFPRPATRGYGTISKSFSTAVSAIIAGEDVQTELSRAARTIDEDIAAHRGHAP